MQPGSDTDEGGSAVQFDLSPSPEKRDTWMQGTRAASAKRASPSPQPTSQRARAASGSRATSRGRRAGAKEVWPDPSAAVHQRVAVDPHAVTTDDCARQLEADRAHMLELKMAIETLHKRLAVQEEKSIVQNKVLEEQKAINFGMTKDAAKLKGDCEELQGILEGDQQNLREYVDATFNGLKPLIIAATTETIEARVELITRDLGELMGLVHIHEQRELEMAAYLENVVAPAVGERPAEGKYIVHALEHFESQLETLRVNVGELMLDTSRSAGATEGITSV